MTSRVRLSQRLQGQGVYAFDEIDKLCAARRAEGVDVIDFGVGDPTEPTPDVVCDAGRAGILRHRSAGYPSYVGAPELRAAIARWIARRHGVHLDPATQITTTVGSKEAVFHAPLAFVDPGRLVLVPSPGYPPYTTGTRFAGGRVRPYAVFEDGPLLPDLEALDETDARDLAVVWITQPHVPTGRVAGRAELLRLLQQCRERSVLLCSDEAYSELGFHGRPPGALEVGVEGLLVFQSLSKQANMTGWRIGWVAGDEQACQAFRRLKTQIDSGVPNFVQDGARAALDATDVAAPAREAYRQRAALLVPALRALGCRVEAPQAGLYLWVTAPGGSGLDFAKQLLAGPPALVVVPGEWLASEVDGRHPGQGRVRMALVPETARCAEAAERLARW